MLFNVTIVTLIEYLCFLEPEKNFALESYGKESKCFEHSDTMWEERSCTQSREWQHWGSGCYKFKCKLGRLHIIVNHLAFSILG